MPITKTSQNAQADVFTAIAHPVRRRILDTLLSGDVSVTQLAEPFDISRSAISQHLSILLETELVIREKRGRENYYRLRPDNLNEVHQWISQYEQFWSNKLDALGAYLDSMADDAEDEPPKDNDAP